MNPTTIAPIANQRMVAELGPAAHQFTYGAIQFGGKRDGGKQVPTTLATRLDRREAVSVPVGVRQGVSGFDISGLSGRFHARVERSVAHGATQVGTTPHRWQGRGPCDNRSPACPMRDA